MSVGKICVRTVWTATPEESVREAARRMTLEEIGTLVVLDEERRPLGIVTDRDVTVRCVGEGLDPDRTDVGSIMTAPVSTVQEDTPIEEAAARMAGWGVRRLPVVDAEERLVGLLSIDDLLELLAEEQQSVGRLLGRRERGGAGPAAERLGLARRR